jgi:hypothetical protein
VGALFVPKINIDKHLNRCIMAQGPHMRELEFIGEFHMRMNVFWRDVTAGTLIVLLSKVIDGYMLTARLMRDVYRARNMKIRYGEYRVEKKLHYRRKLRRDGIR